MFHFDGAYKRSPVQSLGGFSVETDRISLIKKAQEERRRREEIRKKEISSLRIQSLFRSFSSRIKAKHVQRQNFDNYIRTIGLRNVTDLEYLLKRLIFFYNIHDEDKLIFISQFILKNLKEFCELIFNLNSGSEMQWQFRIKRLLVLCTKQILSTKTSAAIPMRILQIFTSFDTIKINSGSVEDRIIVQFLQNCFLCLANENYFEIMNKILNTKIPEHAYEQETTRPSNEISRTILEMIERPLRLVNIGRNVEFTHQVISLFIAEILVSDFSLCTSNFIIPSLAMFPEFPFVQFVRTIHEALTVDSSLCNKKFIERLRDGNVNAFLLYSVIKMDENKYDEMVTQNCMIEYISVIGSLLDNAVKMEKLNCNVSLDDFYNSSESDDDDDENMDVEPSIERIMINRSIELLNDKIRSEMIAKLIDQILCEPSAVQKMSLIVHNLIIINQNSSHENRIVGMLAYRPEVIRTLWYNLLTAKTRDQKLSISVLSRGMVIAQDDRSHVVPILLTFCALFGKLLTTLHDGEFFYCHLNCDDQNNFTSGANVEPIENRVMPFHIKEIVHMCWTLRELCVGLVELVYPETRSALTRRIFDKSETDDSTICQERVLWSHLLKICVLILRQLHSRDLRCNFCPPDHWIAQNLNLPLDRPNDLHIPSRRRESRAFQPVRDFTRKNQEDEPPLSTKQLRSITILREIPFVVPFNKRFEVLQGLIAAEKLRSQGDLQGFMQGPQTHLNVRRTHIYEDAFDKLSPENEPNLRTRFRVQMINQHQLEEAGIDGGGIFREFLSELIKQSFDPNRGFFILTKDNMLYPNPCASLIQDNYLRHYYFIGRMLGKAIFENLLVELPLAEFFLSKLAGRHTDIIDVHQLASLDPDMHKNLMKLKNYDENDFRNLGLDFTVVCDNLGEAKVVELKQDGSNIPVNSGNWIEYVSAMTDFKLNRQIKQQCNEFRQGLSNVLPISWLYMFNTKELQVLISGAEIPIDVDDLMSHTKYGGDYTPEHKTVKAFWKVVRGFDDSQRRQLLKFVTSCSRPPLLGFKDLDPPFCIQNSGDDLNRLVTASTCLNLLKLPEYRDEYILKDKLLYAIQSGVGFELS